jgi:predicted membrane protein
MNPPTQPPPQPQPDHGNNAFNGSIGAVILIAIGAVLFLDNLGLVPFANIRAYWPLAISAWGIALLSRTRGSCGLVWPWTMISIGALLTLGNLHIIRMNAGSIWPIFLIAAGISMLLRRTGWDWTSRWNSMQGAVHDADRPRHFFGPGERLYRKFNGNIMRVNVAFGGVNRRIDSATFEGADLNCTFGELKVDLRGATISTPNREAIVYINASFGAIKLRIPETWKVVVHGTAVFGNYEDKTVPPRPVPGIDPPTVVIRGNASFGAVEIEN